MSGTGQRFVLEPEAAQLLRQYGITYPDHGMARDAQEAVEIAERLGYPVVLKIVSPDVVHKSDVGGVVVGLENAEGVRMGCHAMLDSVEAHVPGAHIDGVLVCEQAREGLEVIVGALDDATFGPTVIFGLGGIFAEVLRDISFRIAPLKRRDAVEMVREIRGYAMLAGTRGQAPRDEKALIDLLMAVSRLVMYHLDFWELDLNPVCLYEEGLQVLDVRLLLKED